MQEDLLYQIALIQTAKIGPVTAKKLYQQFGSAKAVFEQDLNNLLISGLINKDSAAELLKKEQFSFAEQEMVFMEKFGIKALCYDSADYPKRLKHFEDAPFLLYYKGECNLNATRIVAIVGTRKPTDYGRQHCESLVEALKDYNVTIVSGLAFGIDGCAHQKSVELGIPNVGIVAHGLDRIYPHTHTNLAQRMIKTGGGILTEFPSRTEPMAGNFPARNRIIAGMCDALVVVETAMSGGSIISANMANEYQKDVFAIPGRIGDTYSEGSNHLIKTHRASLLSTADDIAYILRWERQEKGIQKQLFVELSAEERIVTDILLGKDSTHINFLIQETGLSTSRLATVLLELEMKGILRSLPGKYFRLA
jgi:DNA processing protein